MGVHVALRVGRGGVGRAARALTRSFSSSADGQLRVQVSAGIKTLIYNNPKKLNAWTSKLMMGIRAELDEAASNPSIGAVVLTGTDPYYCAGVDLGAMVSKPMWPSALHALLVSQNTALFETFLCFPKPLFAAVNGPAIGASVTSATLGEGIIASEKATFHTPFHALGIVPEGCSSVHFARLMGEENAERMLGAEGWKPTAAEALGAGLVQKVVPHEDLLSEAQKMAEEWVAAAKPKKLVADNLLEEYKAVNEAESRALADAFLSPSFFENQANMATKKGKTSKALFFSAVKALRPLWGMSLPAPKANS
mmetsp:Transcript_8534/g.20848  ORF Transcript_8534/g.20848 Transcript_8534/m.20848 type:complete len:309 (+) Transcript_8534:3-929(+)